jgi:hypothetical protein
MLPLVSQVKAMALVQPLLYVSAQLTCRNSPACLLPLSQVSDPFTVSHLPATSCRFLVASLDPSPQLLLLLLLCLSACHDDCLFFLLASRPSLPA